MCFIMYYTALVEPKDKVTAVKSHDHTDPFHFFSAAQVFFLLTHVYSTFSGFSSFVSPFTIYVLKITRANAI